MVVCCGAADVRTILLLGEVSDCLLSARDCVRCDPNLGAALTE